MLTQVKNLVPINWGIVNPYNIILITLIVWLSGLGLALIFPHASNGAPPEN